MSTQTKLPSWVSLLDGRHFARKFYSFFLLESGAALYGAALTKGFRTKDIRVQDMVTYGIDISYEADLVEGGE